ncbi:MAG: type IV secretory system conjugative DNA transfer family protein [Caldisericum sp.]
MEDFMEDFKEDDKENKEETYYIEPYIERPPKKKEPPKPKSPVDTLIEISNKKKKKLKPNYYFDLHLGRGCILDLEEIEKGEIDVYVDFKTRLQHLGCIGTTGTGKTRLMIHMIVQDILAGNSVFIVDPKYDDTLLSSVITAACVAGRLDDVIYFNPILPKISNRINLLASHYILDEIVDHVVTGVKAKEEYFENVAYEVTLSIVLGLYALAKAKGEKFNINFYEVKKWCSYNSLAELKNNLSYLTNSNNEEIRKLASDVILSIDQILSSPADFFAKVSSSLRTVLTSLSISTAGELIGKASYNELLSRLENGKSVIAYCNTGVMLMRKTSHIFGRILTSMIQSLIGRILAKGSKLVPPLIIYLDEGHNMLYRGVDELFAKGRAANVSVNFFTQSISSIKNVMGEEYAKIIMDNISTWIYFRVNCEETAMLIENSLPKSKSYTKRFVPGKDGASVILGEAQLPLYDAGRITKLPNRRFILKLKDKIYICDTPEVKEPNLRIILPLDLRAQTLAIMDEIANEASVIFH